jgi:hypothetical protein
MMVQQILMYVGMTYAFCGALLPVVEVLKMFAAQNGSEGPEDKALSSFESFLHSAADLLGRLGPDFRAKK